MPVIPYDMFKAFLGLSEEPENDDLDDEDDEDPVEDDGDTFDMEHVISLIPEQELRNLLLDLANMSSEARDLIAIRYSDDPEEDQIRRLQKSLRRFEAVRMNKELHVLDLPTVEYASNLIGFLEQYVDELICAGKYTVANQLTNSVYETLGSHFDEDLHGELCSVAEACVARWNEILPHVSEKQRLEMLEWLEGAIQTDDCDTGATEVLMVFLDDAFTDPASVEHRLALLEEEIDELDAMGENRSRLDTRILGGDIITKLSYLGTLERPPEETDAILQKYWFLSDVRQVYVDVLEEENHIDEAIQVLLEGAKLDLDEPEQLAWEGERLIALYQMPGQTRTPKTDLIHRIFAESCPDMEQLRQLRALCTPEEWTLCRENLLGHSKYRDLWYPLMEEDGLYERLLTQITEEDALEDMDRFESVLKPRFPEEVRKFYVSCLEEAAQFASNRTAYAGLIPYLKKLESYPDGEAVVKEITEHWKVWYARRSAMMDELQKAGF